MESGRTRTGSSSSRKNKGPKKIPQRGLGVEQLERIRTQESLKKMAEEASGSILHHHHQQQQQFLQSHFVNATGNYNFHRYGALSSTGAFQFQQQQQQMMMINENNNVGCSAFHPFVGNNKNGFVGNSSGWFVPNNQQNNLVAVGSNYGGSGSFLVKNPLEPSKELSSIPNFNSQGFDLCLKKTCLNEENVMRGRNVRRDTFDDIVGFLPQSSVHNFIGENGDFYNKFYKHDESVEVVAVHRRENSSNGNGKVFMEYDFFKGKDGKGNMKFGTSTRNYGFGEASTSSSITFTGYGDRDTTTSGSGSDSLDLSLKL